MPADDDCDDDLPSLVDRCLSGDEGAVSEFVTRFERAVFGVCLRMLRDRHDAEDVSQETFLRVLRNLDRWDRTRPIMPWLITIAANRCRTKLEKRSRTPTPVEDVPEAVVAEHGGDGLGEELERAVGLLPENWRQAFVLHYEGGLSCRDAAGVLNCAEGTIKTWLFRARKQLAEELRERGLAAAAGAG